MINSLLQSTLKKEKLVRIPFWFMRQAGRYLPEYRDLRTKAGSFLDLCYNPEMAAEVTLQPIRRFDMDAAIVFSDILVIPHAMGMDVRFEQGEGPKLSPIRDYESASKLNTENLNRLDAVYETLRKVRRELADDKSLIGFCGAPWTVACYMVEGGSSRDYENVRIFALKEEKTFSLIIDRIIESSVTYLSNQVKSGADVIQVFDSWAGVLSENEYKKWVIDPTRKLIKKFKEKNPSVPVIGFPRGSGNKYNNYVLETGVDAVSIDVMTPMAWAKDSLKTVLQGNLDPVKLAHDKNAAVEETKSILKTMQGKSFIFNLGHGILQHTPVENVQAVCKILKEGV